MLSWWQGTVSGTGATTSGEDVVVDQHYRHVATLKGAGGWIISEHEMIISGPNAWVTAYKTCPLNLTPYGGSANGVVLDSAVQEYDLKTGQLLYTWDALNPGGTPNIPLSQSQQKPFPGIPWDAYHINSIQLTGNETFLVSMRNTWTAYLVNRTTNAVDWTREREPEEQHVRASGQRPVPVAARRRAARRQRAQRVRRPLLRDQGDLGRQGAVRHSERAEARAGPQARTSPSTPAASVQATPVPGTFNAAFLGNIELLPGGNVALGWGLDAVLLGGQSKTARCCSTRCGPCPDLNYRTYVQKWVGIPFFAPSGAVRNNGAKATVYASWDGDTQVVSWRVLAGSSANSLKAVATTTKTGFETTIPLTSSSRSTRCRRSTRAATCSGPRAPFPTSSSGRTTGCRAPTSPARHRVTALPRSLAICRTRSPLRLPGAAASR